MRRHLGRSAVRSRRRSAAGYLTVLKNSFAGTQAAQMSEGPPLTYFSRSRGTCDVTSAVRRSVRGGARSAVRRSVRRAPTQTSRKQLNASSSGPSNTPRVECGDLEAERTCSSQPRPLGVHAAEARSVIVSAIEQTEPRRPSAARRWQRERPASAHDAHTRAAPCLA